jgi:hypothetical protein
MKPHKPDPKDEQWKPDDMANRPGGLTLEKMSVNAREVGLDYEPEKAQEPFKSVADTDLQGFIANDYSHILVYPKGSYPEGGVELYTALPKREWVGLTKEEFFKIYNSSATIIKQMSMIEAKLKEKNT